MTPVFVEGLRNLMGEQCDPDKASCTPPVHDDCPYDSTPVDQCLQVSIGVVLLAFMASEVLVMVLCKIAAWYAHVSFYSQFSNSSYMDYWDDDFDETSRDRRGTIQEALTSRPYSLEETERNIKNDMWCLSLEGPADANDACCPICLVEFVEQDTVSSGRSCHHLFHKQCISQWLQNRSSCPYCRADMFSEPKLMTEKANNITAQEDPEENDEAAEEVQEAPRWGIGRLWTLICRMLESRDSLDVEFCMFLF